MTETTSDTAESPPAPPRLERPQQGRLVAGVCAGLGRHTDIDPIVYRVMFAVLAVVGGAGIVIYALAWLLMPETGEDRSIAERVLHSPSGRLSSTTAVIAMLVGGAVVLALDDGHSGAITVLVLGALIYLVHRQRSGSPIAWAGPPGPPATPAATSPGPQAMATLPRTPAAPADGGWSPAPPPARAARERSRLGALTVSVTALVAGGLALASTTGVEELTAARIVAISLMVVGGGLVVGAWVGRARWLIVIATVLALSLAPVAVGETVLDDGAGERFWTPAASNIEPAYRLGAGTATLNLVGIRDAGSSVVHARVGVGELVVIVPTDRTFQVIAHVGAGDIQLPSGNRNGLDVDWNTQLGSGVPAGVVRISVGIGHLEVRYA